MRLNILDNGHRPIQRAFLKLVGSMSEGGVVPGPLATLTYRRQFFGKSMAGCLQESMREAEHWTMGEVELFAAFVSSLNECDYCTGDHAAVAAMGLGDDKLIQAVLADWRTAPVNGRVRAALGFLEKVTLRPEDVGPDDIAVLRAAGLEDDAVSEALYVCFSFNVMSRLADAFDFHVPSEAGAKRTARILRRTGYRLASLPG